MTIDELKTKLLRQLDEVYLELRKEVAATDYVGDTSYGISYILPQSEVSGMMNVIQKIVNLNQIIID